MKPLPPNRSDFVLWLRALGSGRTFPTYVFSADTDMPYVGQVAFTSHDGRTIVRTQFTPDEMGAGEAGLDACLARTRTALGRDDLLHVGAPRVEQVLYPPELSGHDLFAYLLQHPARVFYRDPLDPTDEAVEESRVPPEAFVATGGAILDYDPR